MNDKLAACYNKGGKSNMFSIHVDATLFCLKHQLNQFNGRFNHIDKKKVDIVEYRHPSIDFDRSVRFT